MSAWGCGVNCRPGPTGRTNSLQPDQYAQGSGRGCPMRSLPLLLTLAATLAAAPADLVLRNGKVVTMDSAKPAAQAVAVTRGRIEAVGTNPGNGKYIGPATHVTRLSGKLTIPGFLE